MRVSLMMKLNKPQLRAPIQQMKLSLFSGCRDSETGEMHRARVSSRYMPTTPSTLLHVRRRPAIAATAAGPLPTAATLGVPVGAPAL